MIQSQIITLHDSNWLERQTIAGKCVAQCLKTSKEKVLSNPEKLTGKDIESICLKIMESFSCSPTFFGYKCFPGAICLSINNELVHGIPKDKPFQIGDVIKIDLGATYQGAIADAAITVIYGSPKENRHVELIDLCQKSLTNGIKAIKQGKQLGVIGNAIHKTVKDSRFGLILNYGGHGIDENQPHASPFVPNKSQPNEGPKLQPGMTLAIEPMLVIGDNKTSVSNKDNWTVLTNGVGAHFEHTIFITENEVKILTDYLN